MNESIESILAEMRREVGDGEDTYCGKRIIRRMDDVRVRQYCARIEAAAKREKSEIEANALAVGGVVEAARHTPGNAAAMREALLNIQEYAAAMDVDDGNVLAILDACRDALSAPARNCDLYATANEGRRAFNVWLKHNRPMSFGGWLLAPAAERKGEGDGR